MNDRALEDPVEDVDSLIQDYKKLSDHFLTTRPLMISFISPSNEKPEERRDCLLKIEFDDEPSELYWLCSGYYEHGRWMLFNGCSRPLDLGDIVVGWRYLEQ